MVRKNIKGYVFKTKTGFKYMLGTSKTSAKRKAGKSARYVRRW